MRSNLLHTAAVAAILLAFLASTGPSRAGEGPKELAYQVVDRNVDQMAKIGDSIYYFAELGMQEFESAKLLRDTLQAAGFTVELGGAGMPTNVWAKCGSGKPVIAIVTEVDALQEGSQTPGEFEHKPLVEGAPGHMEGHNTHGGVATTAVFAVKEAMTRYNIPGTVVVSFGPAEEQILSRPFLVRAGYFKDVDGAIILHIGDNSSTGYGLQNYAAISSKFTFHGRTAHGAINPWDGKDAVDAVELMDIGFDKLREHLRPTYRAHRTISMGGLQPNIIPDTGQIWWYVRDANGPDAKATYDKLVKIAEGAALMTGTTFDMEYVASAWPQLGNKAIAAAIQNNIDTIGLPQWTPDEVAFAKAFQHARQVKEVGLNTKPTPLGQRPQSTSSNDNGDATWNVPTGLMAFPASVPGITYHHWAAAVTPTSTIAHKGMVVGAKVLAASVLDLMTSAELRAQAQAQFEDDTKETKYFSLLPPDAKPPLDLNRAMMEKYRPAMSKFYLNATPRLQ
jgi:aminobenzoyl-glutamate utilization protein B